MLLTLPGRINAFAELGQLLDDFLNGKLENTENSLFLNEKINIASRQNPWFGKKNILHAISGISHMLKKEKLNYWLKPYNKKLQSTSNPKNIAVIMAGNIPLVNFHDFLCVLITGHNIIAKLSSNDSILPVALSELLINIEPDYKNKIQFTTDNLSGFDAVIATGSNNAARYFEYYFGKYPYIIRKNRNSVAILDGNEDTVQLKALSEDIFRYYGLGCRNVSKLLVPENYTFNRFFESLENWKTITDFYKYKNNYDYYKAMFLVNKTPHLDNGFLLLKEDKSLSSPLSVLYYQAYKSKDNISSYLSRNKDLIQCIVGSNIDLNGIGPAIAFGKSQFPELWDYPDDINTIDFLLRVS